MVILARSTKFTGPCLHIKLAYWLAHSLWELPSTRSNSSSHPTTITGMIEPTPRTIPTKARLQIVDAVGLVGPLRVRLATAPQSQLPQRLFQPGFGHRPRPFLRRIGRRPLHCRCPTVPVHCTVSKGEFTPSPPLKTKTKTLCFSCFGSFWNVQ